MTKQVDRLLSNEGIDVDALLARWVPFMVGARKELVVAMDWTDFDADGQATLMLSLLTRHGRATPLLWLTVEKATLKDRRNEYEYWAVTRLARVLNVPTTAEGIETKEQLEMVRAAGCTEFQGYLFGKPRPAAEVKPLLRLGARVAASAA